MKNAKNNMKNHKNYHEDLQQDAIEGQTPPPKSLHPLCERVGLKHNNGCVSAADVERYLERQQEEQEAGEIAYEKFRLASKPEPAPRRFEADDFEQHDNCPHALAKRANAKLKEWGLLKEPDTAESLLRELIERKERSLMSDPQTWTIAERAKRLLGGEEKYG